MTRGKDASTYIREKSSELVLLVTECHEKHQPSFSEQYAEKIASYHRDTEYHLSHLSSALHLSSVTLFVSYIQWVKVLFEHIGVSIEDLRTSIDCLKEAIDDVFPIDFKNLTTEYVDAGLNQLEEDSPSMVSYIGADENLSVLVTQYLNSLLNWESETAQKLVEKALRDGVEIKNIYEYIFGISQREVGRLWLTGEISIAQEHFCTSSTQRIMSRLIPHFASDKKKKQSIMFACVAGELHDMGIRMLSDIFEMEGWQSVYLGANTPVYSILSAVEERKPDVLALSATMTFHVPEIEDIITQVRSSGHNPKIIVGGRPFNIVEDLWKQVDADGFAANTEEALVLAEKILQ